MDEGCMDPVAYWEAVGLESLRSAGRDVAGILLPRIPGGLGPLLALPPVEDGKRAFLEADPSAEAAGEAGKALARVGLTPVSLLDAAAAVAGLASRRRGRRDAAVSFAMREGAEADIDFGEAVAMVGMVAEVDPVGAEALAAWILAAGVHVPRLFPDNVCRGGDGILVLEEADDPEHWRPAWAILAG